MNLNSVALRNRPNGFRFDRGPACHPARQRRGRPARQAGGGPFRPGRPARRGPSAHRRRARRRQDAARQGPRPQPRLLVPPHPVHARSAAQRPPRRQRLQPVRRRLRLPAGAAVRPGRPRRRDQPGHAAHPVRPPRSHERTSGVDRRPDPAARPAVLRRGHAKPLRVRGDLPAPGEPARPLPHASAPRLPRPRRRRSASWPATATASRSIILPRSCRSPN